jgi:hypothetical protein
VDNDSWVAQFVTELVVRSSPPVPTKLRVQLPCNTGVTHSDQPRTRSRGSGSRLEVRSLRTVRTARTVNCENRLPRIAPREQSEFSQVNPSTPESAVG